MVDYTEVIRQHGILMILGWSLFVPCGVGCSVLLRHRNEHPKYFFFRPHYILSTAGVILAIVAWIIAHNYFGGFWSYNLHDLGSVHVLFGRIVMFGALVNILIYPITMKLPRYEGERWSDWPLRQKFGQFTHRLFGFFILVLGLFGCWTGIQMVHTYDEKNLLFTHLFVGCLVASVVFNCLLVYDKYKSRTQQHSHAQRNDNASETTALL